MADFENPYAANDPFIRAHFDCSSCGGKLWEYAIERVMVCEDCREVFRTQDVFDAQVPEAGQSA